MKARVRPADPGVAKLVEMRDAGCLGQAGVVNAAAVASVQSLRNAKGAPVKILELLPASSDMRVARARPASSISSISTRLRVGAR